MRGLYLVWDRIRETQDGRLRVNLLLNWASPWADISSWVPYAGRAVIRVKHLTQPHVTPVGPGEPRLPAPKRRRRATVRSLTAR